MAKQPVEKWATLEHSTRLDFCIQYLLLPVLKKGKGFTPEMLEQITPSAVDLERQASALAAEHPEMFAHIQALVEQTTALFLLPETD